MFKAIKDIYCKSKAAAILGNLFQEQVEAGLFPNCDTQELGRHCVDGGWKVKPDMLSGRFGTRPHDISVSTFSLATAIVDSHLNVNRDAVTVDQFIFAFTRIANEAQINGNLYHLTETDRVVLDMAVGSVAVVVEEIEEAGGVNSVT